MIFELYGLPGSGKSFIINKLVKVESNDLVKKSIVKKSMINLAKTLSIWMPSSIKLRKKINFIIKDYAMTPKFIEREVCTHINNILMIAFGYKWSGTRTIYMDEGIIHRIVTFAVNYNLPIEQTCLLIDLFENHLKKALIVYLDVKTIDCISGIQNRNRHNCEMDELKGEKLFHYLNCFKRYFDIIYYKYGHVKINRENYKKLKELLK